MKIEKNVPLVHISRSGRPMKYPWADMSVGDSIMVEGQDTQGPAATAARTWARGKGISFSARSVDGGARIWRVK